MFCLSYKKNVLANFTDNNTFQQFTHSNKWLCFHAYLYRLY